MKTFILLIAAIIFTVPVHAQVKQLPKALKAGSAVTGLNTRVAAQVNGVTRNARAFAVGLTNTPAKQILNARFQFQLEYARAVKLYQHLQNTSSINKEGLRAEIDATIINHTLKNSLLKNLDNGFYSGMTQELEQYFHLSPRLPFFAASATPSESFALSSWGYLSAHPLKPSWQLREKLQFGRMRAIKAQISSKIEEKTTPETVAAVTGLETEEAKELLNLYGQAEVLHAKIREFIAQTSHTPQEEEAFVNMLRQIHDLYAQLLIFAKNAKSITNTVEIYKNLLTEMEEFIAVHHRVPLWKNKDERSLFLLFEPLVLANQANMFEEVVPILTRLYAITETYPVKRLTEKDTLKDVQIFVKKHGFLPRSVHNRDFFDMRKDEAMLTEAIAYWTRNSKEFAAEMDKLKFPQEDNFPKFY